MASNSVDKMDLSLDQIIKLQKKEGKQTRGGGKTVGFRGRGGRGPRGGRPSASILRQNENTASMGISTSPKNRKLGVRANLAARRLARGRTPGGIRAGRGRGALVQQNFAKNLVKRSIMQNRRMAIEQRRNISAGQNQAGRGGAAATRRLQEDVRRWRNTAKQLQRALEIQQGQQQPRFRLRRRFGNAGGVVEQQMVSQPISNVKQRLGWRRTANNISPVRNVAGGRGGFGRRGRGAQGTLVVKGRGTVGQMQSDLVMQGQRQQRRLQMDTYTRGRRQQQIGQQRNMRFHTTMANNTFNNRSPQGNTRGRGRGRGRFGSNSGQFLSRVNDFGTSFNQGVTGRPSLHERFGGGKSPIVRVTNTGFGGRGRGRRQIFFD